MNNEKQISLTAIIQNKLNESPLLNQVLGKDKERYVQNVIVEISKTAGDNYKDLTKCTILSLATAVKQAHDLGLEIDGRQHCHLIKYGNKAVLQIGYRGFIYAIKRAYPDANIKCGLVYEGDGFTLKEEGDLTTYSFDRVNPFNTKEKEKTKKKDEIIGGFCYISYTCGKRLVSFCETMSIEEINKIKNCAKSQSIWNTWFEEKAKVALIRRGCKIHFNGIGKINEMEEFDNQDFDLNNPSNVSKTDNIPDDLTFNADILKKEVPQKETKEQITQEDALQNTLFGLIIDVLKDESLSYQAKKAYIIDKKSQIEKLPESKRDEINHKFLQISKHQK